MSREDERIITENIKLGFEFARNLVDDPSSLEDIPDGATVVIIPDDDPEVAERNIELALKAVREGADVYIRHARKPASV